MRLVVPGYTLTVKTAISVPDETFEEVERRSAQLGMSRSEFYATAARRYLKDLDRESVTERLNEALAVVEGDDETSDVVSAGRRRLAAGDDW